MKVTEQADTLGGVHNQKPGSLHPEAGSPAEDADQVQNQHRQDGTASAAIVPARPGP
jgi:hypothetical protein